MDLAVVARRASDLKLDETPAAAAEAREVLKALQRVKRAVEQDRKASKAPYSNAADLVDQFFMPVVKSLDDLQSRIKADLEKIIQKQAMETLARELKRKEEESKIKASETEERVTAPIVLDATPAPAGVASALSTYEHTTWEIEDFAAIPREFLCVDKRSVDAAVAAGKVVPGIKVTTTRKVANR
jgi:hypothetical protein